MKYLLGIDLGTSSLKSLIVDEEGSLVDIKAKEYGIDTPYPGWAEQNPLDWWEATKETLKKLLLDTKIKSNDIVAIGLSGQMHGTVIIDKKMKYIRPSIIWADQRTERECEQIYEKVGKERLKELTCNPLAPGFMAASLLWLKKNEPDRFKRVYKVLLPKDYLRLRLTVKIATEVTDASSTLLFNVRERKWSIELLKLIDLPEQILPEVSESHEVIGEIPKEIADETGLAKGTLVIAGGGDQSMAALGNGVIKSGTILSTIGTGGATLYSHK